MNQQEETELGATPVVIGYQFSGYHNSTVGSESLASSHEYSQWLMAAFKWPNLEVHVSARRAEIVKNFYLVVKLALG